MLVLVLFVIMGRVVAVAAAAAFDQFPEDAHVIIYT
jgi:hypothetical protein